jgi:hypothetical protein
MSFLTKVLTLLLITLALVGSCKYDMDSYESYECDQCYDQGYYLGNSYYCDSCYSSDADFYQCDRCYDDDFYYENTFYCNNCSKCK